MTDFEKLKEDWNGLGETDPFWAILSDPLKKYNKWDPQTFFKTGVEEVSVLMHRIQILNISFPRNNALDFVCGVGRLTQALCHHFDRCYGVDIAPSMIRLAKKYNQYGDRCRYLINDRADLSFFENNCFDFIYSTIVLQHMDPEYSKRYLKEFLRVLTPGGLLVFQIPSELNHSSFVHILNDAAFKAKITMEQPIAPTKSGGQAYILVKVKNMSNLTWPADASINLGNHWLDLKGNLLILDDGRAPLAKDLGAMEEVTLSLPITFPKEPGDFILELDMVQELVTWFKDKGSDTTKIPIKITEGKSEGLREPTVIVRTENNKTALTCFFTRWLQVCRFLRKVLNPWLAKSQVLFGPEIEMYGIPQGLVLDLMKQWEGKIISVQEDCKAGPEWRSYTYYVTK
jgi:ubiquinone/menaquinone biosynthesis C-methylase UbiE